MFSLSATMSPCHGVSATGKHSSIRYGFDENSGKQICRLFSKCIFYVIFDINYEYSI